MAKFKVEIKRAAIKEIESLSRKDILSVLEKIRSLADDPRSGDGKKLSGQEKYRIRCGNYLILYLIENDARIVYVIKAGHR
ncbi:MAG: type II toxin-antitoxin system RelE/ParE family toxin [Candidatus Omnitrophota bacterium]